MEKSEINNIHAKSLAEGSQTQLQQELNKLYEQQNYPSKEEMTKVVDKFDTTIKKVTNWFKQKRRRQFLKGKLIKQNYQKNWFSNDQVSFLKKWFVNNMHPTTLQYCQLAKSLNTTQKHIKNWFSHQRQKLSKMPEQKNSVEQQNQNPPLNQQNFAFLHQIIQNMPLHQRLQLVLGNNVSQNFLQSVAPVYMNNQYMIAQFLQTQQYISMIQNALSQIPKNEENSPTSTILQYPLYQQEMKSQQPPKQSFKLVNKNEQS